ncbi:MAG: inositol-3-phosphate synthase [Acidobacteria bacterium]|nr:inositol-3-phosphate synthase [Acidobacteriota bacterium]
MGKKIRIAIAGVGNCASSLIQGIEYYKLKKPTDEDREIGLMHYDLGGYLPEDIEVVAAFDIDKRKVGKPLTEAIYAKPNCTKTIVPEVKSFSDVIVQMGKVLDGVSPHMTEYAEERTFLPAPAEPVDVAKVLKDTGAEILLNYMPVGSVEATEYYANACLEAGVSFINCVPVFIVSNEKWAERFERAGIPVVGDDIKSQLGATITHRTLSRLLVDRGCKLDKTYQLNVGGNTDFLNMLNRSRLKQKKISKTEAVQSILDVPLAQENIHIGPSDYVPWLNDNKLCFLRIEGRMFGGVPFDLELRLSVEDSPNSAGVAIDAIRCVKLARERGVRGPLTSISAYTMKHPPEQYPDYDARVMVEEFIAGKRER